jgi:hypothetical protein
MVGECRIYLVFTFFHTVMRRLSDYFVFAESNKWYDQLLQNIPAFVYAVCF